MDQRTESDTTALVPGGAAHIEEVADDCRQMVHNHALLAASVSLVPFPGLSWLADVGALMRMLPKINEAFGLTPEQVAKLAPDRQLVLYKIVSAGGGMLVGKLITRGVILKLLKSSGVRLSARQTASFVPVAGRFVAAGITYASMRWIAEQHIRECVHACNELRVAPEESAAKLQEPEYVPEPEYNQRLGV